MSTVAGLDCAFGGDRVFAVVVVWDVERRRVIERRALSRPLQFPYVPGLLSFREAPALLAALRRLRTPVDALLCDGQGIAHPRRFGLACHLGVLLGLPAVGCAKSRLIGEWAEPGGDRGEGSPLTHDGKRIGTVLRTRTGVKPLFVSPGHLCDFEGAADLVLRCGGGLRL
ncbi:MAG: endonuclease V, partial [Gammaproteobacteria bacterium]|nr:endonuclease V [Gammaproteobacteria bacterium]